MRLILLFCLLPVLLSAQDEPAYNIARIPPGLLKDAYAIVRSQQITLTVSAPDEAVFRERRVVTLFNNKTDYNELNILYNSFNKIGRIRGSLYDAGGNFLRDLEKKEIGDYSAVNNSSLYTDSRLRSLEAYHDKYPYTIVFDYEVRYRDILTYPDWEIQHFHTAVENASMTVVLENNLKLHYKALNIDLQPQITPEGAKTRYYWEVGNLPAVRYEPLAPSSFEILPQVLVSPDVFKADNYTGSMASWQKFGQFQYDLAKGRDVLSAELKTRVRELTATARTDAEKIAVLYRYMQENVRYVSVQLGIGGWQPFDAQYVEKNRYGDCKALSNFMKALLQEAGISSCTALVQAGDAVADLPDDFASSQFNHAILYVPGPDVWLECTSSNAPPNYLGTFTGDREVLLVTEKGGKLARTPALSPEKNTSAARTDIQVTTEGKAMINVASELTGTLQEWYRDAAQDLPPEELKKKLQEKNPLPQAYFNRLTLLPQTDKPAVRLNYGLEVPQFGSKAGKRLFLPINPVSAYTDVPPANDDRIHPIVRREGYTWQDTVILRLPEGYTVESIPAENTTLTSEFGSYSSQVLREEGRIRFVRRLEMKPFRAPAARYGEWRTFCRDVAKADGMKVVLVSKT